MFICIGGLCHEWSPCMPSNDPRSYRVGQARFRLAKKIAQNPSNPKIPAWKERVERFIVATKETIPSRYRTRFDRQIRHAEARVRDVHTLIAVYEKMRPQLSVSTRKEYLKAYTAFKEAAQKRIGSRSRLNAALKTFLGMGYPSMLGKRTQFYSGYFKTEADADQFIKQEANRIKNILRERGVRPQQVEQAMQEMYAFILRRLMEYRPELSSSVASFLSRTAQHAAYHYFEKRNTVHARRAALDMETETAVRRPLDSSLRTNTQRNTRVRTRYAMKRSQRYEGVLQLLGERGVQKAIAALPVQEREITRLRFDGLTSKEIAQRLGIPDSTVRWRSANAMKRILRAIKKAKTK